jgi:hypothetical protein
MEASEPTHAYILRGASGRQSIGVTNNLDARLHPHRDGQPRTRLLPWSRAHLGRIHAAPEGNTELFPRVSKRYSPSNGGWIDNVAV